MMKTIDAEKLSADLRSRFEFVAEFIGFTAADVETLHASAPLVAPHVPALVDGVYQKLFSYDLTKKHFLKPNAGYRGPIPLSLEELTLDHEIIKFRKLHLGSYLSRLVTGKYDETMISFLDAVGSIHTAAAGHPDVQVSLVEMNALLGFVADQITALILSFNLPAEIQGRTLRAFQKLLWIQNDFISKHYTR